MSLRQLAGVCTLGAYLLMMGFLGGTIVSAIRFDQQRAAILSKLDDASTRVRAKLMLVEHDAARSAEPRDEPARSAALHPNEALRAR
jgi:hypothetical protein